MAWGQSLGVRDKTIAAKRWRGPVVPPAVTALALALRLPALGKSFNGDEIFSQQCAVKPIGALLHCVATTDSHPPLYYLLLHGWRLAGSSEVWVRLLSVALGVSTCWLIYSIAALVASRRGALIAAVLAATSPTLIGISQLARNYALVTFAVALSTYLLARLLRRPNIWGWIGYTAAAAAGLYSFYYAAYALAAHNAAFAAAGPHDRRMWRNWAIAQAAVAGLFAPWLRSLARQIGTVAADTSCIDTTLRAGNVISCLTAAVGGVEPFEILPVRLTSGLPGMVIEGGFAAVGCAVFITWLRRRDRKMGGAALMALMMSVAIALAVAGRIAVGAYLRPSYLAFVSVFGCVLAGACLERASWKWIVPLAAMGMTVQASRLPAVYAVIEDWRGCAALLEAHVRPEEQVCALFAGGADYVEWYSLNKVSVQGLPPDELRSDGERDLIRAVKAEHMPAIARYLTRHGGVWMVWSHIKRGSADRGSGLVKALFARTGYVVQERYLLQGVTVEHYVRAGPHAVR